MNYHIKIDPDVFLPCYRHLHQSKSAVNLLYGGRDSGKSHFIAQELIIKCLTQDYFRCLIVKKTYPSIKDSQFQTLKDIVTEWGLEPLFKFYTSPYEIVCKNGNKFIARGCDAPEKLKSIKDPTDAWFEEGNQLTEDDYTIISTTLRGPNNQMVQEWFSFNPEVEGDYKDHWIYKRFFAKYPDQKSFAGKIITEAGGEMVEIDYTATHTTYYDNPYCTPDRQAKLEALKTQNYYYYLVYTLGLWGLRKNDNPWAFAFNRDRHLREGMEPDRRIPLWLSWDFNRNPVCCSIIQHFTDKKEIRVLETIKLQNSGVDAVCDLILAKYPGFLYMVTGDYSGNSMQSLFREQITNYSVIRKKLNIGNSQIKIRPNPPLKHNRTLFNLVLQYYGFVVDPVKASGAVFDLEFVEARADGTIVKDDRDDPKQQSDALDTMRYFVNMEMSGFEKRYLREVVQ